MTLRLPNPAYLLIPLILVIEGWAIAAGRNIAVEVPLFFVAVFLLARKPWYPVAAVALYTGIIEADVYRAHSLPLPVILMGAGFIAAHRRGLPQMDKLGWAIVGLIAATVLGVYVGEHAVGQHQAVLYARALALLPTYWLALQGFQRNRGATIRILGTVAAVIAAMACLQEIIGQAHPLFVARSLTVLSQDGFLRVRPPGQLLEYVALVFACAHLLWGERKRGRLLYAMLMLGGVLLTGNRDMIVGGTAGLIVAAVFGSGHARSAVRFATVAALAGVALLLTSNTGITQRVLSLHNTAQLQSGTLADRSYENNFAEAAIRAHPLLGVGWGAPYGALSAEPVTGVLVDRPFVHNQYLALWLRTGLLGLLCFAAALWIALRRSLREQSWVGRATVASLVAVGLSSIVGIFVVDASSSVVVVCLLALASTLGRSDSGEVTS